MFSKTKRILGVDIGSHAIKAVLLKKAKKGSYAYELEKIAMKPVASQVIVEGDIIDSVAVVEVLDSMMRSLKAKVNDVAISLSGNSVIIKKISVNRMTEEELADSIQWEAEQYIPFEIEDVMVDYEVLPTSTNPDQMDVILVAVKKDKVNDYTSVISQVGKNTALVDVDIFAIQNCFEVNYEDYANASVGIVNIGASVTSVNIIERGVTAFWRDIIIGGNLHTEALQRRLGLGVELAEEAKRRFEVEGASTDAVIPVLDSASEELVDVIAKTFDFYYGSSSGSKLEKVFISGGASNTRGLMEMLSTRLGATVEQLDPFRNVGVNQKHFVMEYIQDQAVNFAVAMGLAVREVDRQ